MTKHNHYFKNVEHLQFIDVYRVISLFGVTDGALQHALKKLLVAGGRGAGKDHRRDIQEAIDSLQRHLEMLDEDDKKQQLLFDLKTPVGSCTNISQQELYGQGYANLEPKEIKIETYNNKTGCPSPDTCVRIEHLPSGIIIEADSERSLIANKAKAFAMLSDELHKLEQLGVKHDGR